MSFINVSTDIINKILSIAFLLIIYILSDFFLFKTLKRLNLNEKKLKMYMFDLKKGYFHSTTSIHNFRMGFLSGRQKRARWGRSGGGLPPRLTGRLGAGGVRAPAWPPPGLVTAVAAPPAPVVAPATVLIAVGVPLSATTVLVA